MKKVKSALAIVAILGLTLGFVSTKEWVLVELRGCSMEFPEKPNTEVQTVNSAIGDLKMEITMYDAEGKKDDNLVYGILTTEYPDSLVNSNKKELLSTFFRNAIDGTVNQIKGKLLSEKEIEINGFPGREIRIDAKNGLELAIVKTRFYLVNNKLFCLETITEPAKESNAAATRFLDSFKLTK